MPIHFATEPKNGTSLVEKGLSRLAGRTSPLSGRGLDFAKLRLSPPHAVYDLHADAVAAGGGLASATRTGFRYFIAGGEATVAGAEVHTDANGTATLLANINYGPYVAATAQALTQVTSLKPVSSGSYEARVLRFSAIALMALWLKSDSGAADIIYPIAPVPQPLQAEQAYSEADFLKAILPLAQRRAAKKDPESVP